LPDYFIFHFVYFIRNFGDTHCQIWPTILFHCLPALPLPFITHSVPAVPTQMTSVTLLLFIFVAKIYILFYLKQSLFSYSRCRSYHERPARILAVPTKPYRFKQLQAPQPVAGTQEFISKHRYEFLHHHAYQNGAQSRQRLTNVYL